MQLPLLPSRLLRSRRARWDPSRRTRGPGNTGPARRQRSLWPPPLPAAARAARTLDGNARVAAAGDLSPRRSRPTLTAALHPASWTRTPARHSRPPPPPPRAGARRPHPPRPADARPSLRRRPCSCSHDRAGRRRRSAPGLAPPARPRPAPFAPAHWPARSGGGALRGRQVGAAAGWAPGAGCQLCLSPQTVPASRPCWPPRAACGRPGGGTVLSHLLTRPGKQEFTG